MVVSFAEEIVVGIAEGEFDSGRTINKFPVGKGGITLCAIQLPKHVSCM
jgi:hypothetical protein